MITKKTNKIAAVETAPQLQEVKLQGRLIAEIKLDTSMTELLEILNPEEFWPSYWFKASGQRIENVNVFDIRRTPEDFPLQLWYFPTKRDIERETEPEILFQ